MSSLWLRLSLLILSLYAGKSRSSPSPLEELLESYKNAIGHNFTRIYSHEFTLPTAEYVRRRYTNKTKNTTAELVYSIRLFDEEITLRFEKIEDNTNNGILCNSQKSPTEKKVRNPGCCWLGKPQHHNNSLLVFNECRTEMLGIIEGFNKIYHLKPLSSSHHQGLHIVYKAIPMEEKHDSETCATNQEIRSWQEPNRSLAKRAVVTNRASKRIPVMEVLVVADQSMVKFHGNATVRQYVLTIMSMVAKFFRDASLGIQLHLVVQNLIILDGKEENLSISLNADKTMKSFCEWQKDHNNHVKSNHDVALLITRLNICADRDEPCGTVGMAYISGMCQSQRRCSMAEDTGLDVAQTIAHELGHNLGIRHDGYGNDCADHTGDIPHIMASTWLKANKRGISKWSKCSRRKFRKYIRSFRSWCLKETSSESVVRLPSVFPGETFTVDQQCKHHYGNMARQCRRYRDRLCRELWCEIEGEYFCRTRMTPPASGTKCGEGKWCMYGNCVNSTSVLRKRDGGWSSWGRWGECSRSCGTGVSTKRRKCNDPRPENGGRYCAGLEERYRLCNTKACPENSKDIRTVQCESYNGQMYRNQIYNWKPLLSKYKPCALYCTPTTEKRFSVQFSTKVIDGTPCSPGSADLCVNGKCHRVGCDQKIGSDAKEDICGICKGNGTTCRIIEGSFNQLSGSGYVEVAVIPVGARNIQVMETKPCTSFLALKGSYDIYYVNGNWKIQLPGQVDVDGTKVIYDRKGTWERLVVKGPTKEPLHVMILYQGYNLGIKYKYSIPRPNKSHEMDKNSGKTSKKPHRDSVNYGWVRRGWEMCSVKCGTGVQKSRKEECVRFSNGRFRVVHRAYCYRATKPKREVRVCNEHQCPIWWSATRWSKCNRKCGSGRQHRVVLCMRQLPNGSISRTSDSACTKDRPSSVQNCYLRTCRVKWATKSWSKCFSICGKGYRFRYVYCPVKGLCDPATKPASRKRCYGASCYSWTAEPWHKCSRTCGYGYQLRSVKCEHKLTKKTGVYCHRLKKPPQIQLCRNRPC